MKIVVGGRFDYMRAAWSKQIEENNILYFENDVFIEYGLSRRIKNRLFQLAYKFGSVDEDYKKEYDSLNNLGEMFDLDSLNKKDEILFILYEMNVLATDFDNLTRLRKKFPKAKFVLFISNSIGTVRVGLTQTILQNRRFYDLIYTFNPKDAEEYGFRLFSEGAFPYDAITKEIDTKYESDLFWIGTNKGDMSNFVESAVV